MTLALQFSDNQAKANTIEVNNIIRETMPTTLSSGEQMCAVRDHEVHAAESLTTAIGIFDKANAGVVEA